MLVQQLWLVILCKKDDVGVDRPIAFFSAKFIKHNATMLITANFSRMKTEQNKELSSHILKLSPEN